MSHTRSSVRFGSRALAVLVLGAGLVGCASEKIDSGVLAAANAGRYGSARETLQKKLTEDPADRSYILDRLRLMILTLADGQPEVGEEVANQTFRLLRTQGINADKTVTAVVFNEGVKVWKGEPFEQALSYAYIAVQKSEVGQWDNARAAANASLFLLKSFGDNEHGEEMSNIELARRAAEEDAANGEGAGDKYINKGYTPIKTNFVLGYLLNGLSNKALGRGDEASDNFHEATVIHDTLRPLAEQLDKGKYNTVFVVDYGPGPTKIATGPDNAFARFQENLPSDERPLGVSLSGGDAPLAQVPPVQDINKMAASLMWNNLEDVRVAKSIVGDALIVGGVAVAASGSGKKHRDTQLAGAGAVLTGILLKASAHADTRHAEFLPQRVYLVPVNITQAGAVVTLEVAGDPASRMVLPAMSPPEEAGKVQLRYVRLNHYSPEAWANSGQVMYGNDAYAGRVQGDTLPYILGGTDVSLPSPAALERYQKAGNLVGLTGVDLENLYRDEGIALTADDAKGMSRRHVLEGGDSLVAPLPGTAGYARLFCQPHPAYKAKSKSLLEFIASQRRDKAGTETKSEDSQQE